jgi:class 3 adenylate cyclase
VLTEVVERHRGVVFQYTGDGLLALFLPELAGGRPDAMLDRLVNEMCPLLHREFDALHARWRADWQAAGRPSASVGLGAGLSFGRVTMGYMGPYGKKQFGAVGEPVNLAALLCAEAEAGSVLIDRHSFALAGFEPGGTRTLRLRSRKLRQRLDAACLQYGSGRAERPFAWLRPPVPGAPLTDRAC